MKGTWLFNGFNGAAPGGSVGATLFAAWSDLNPARGVYTWGSLDAQIAMQAQQGRGVSIMVTVSRSGWYGDELYIDDTPAWVGATRSVLLAGKTMRLPAYDDAQWRAAFATFVAVLGEHYRADVGLQHVTIGLGLDGETHPYKSDYESYVVAALGTAYRGAFERWAKEAIVAYDWAFETSYLYVAANPGGQRFRRELIRDYLIPLGIGYKNCGLQIDHYTAWSPADYTGAGGNYALYAPMRDLQGRVPLWLESTTGGNATPELVYWSLLLGLSWEPAGIDLHKEWFPANPEAIAWANGYLAEPEHGAWIVLRDKEYPSYVPGMDESSTMYLSGWPGDFEHGMARTTEATRVTRAELPAECQEQVESRQARAFANGMTLKVAAPAALGVAPKLRVCYLDGGAEMTLVLGNWGIILGGTATRRFVWREWSVPQQAGWDGTITIEGAGTVHMVEVLRDGAEPEPPPPTPEPEPEPVGGGDLPAVLRELSGVLVRLAGVLEGMAA